MRRGTDCSCNRFIAKTYFSADKKSRPIGIGCEMSVCNDACMTSMLGSLTLTRVAYHAGSVFAFRDEKYIYEVAWLLKTICQDVFNIREYATLPTSTSRHSIFSQVPSQVSPTIERFFDARILVLWLLVQRLLAVAYNTWINLMVDFFRDSDSSDGRGRKQHEK